MNSVTTPERTDENVTGGAWEVAEVAVERDEDAAMTGPMTAIPGDRWDVDVEADNCVVPLVVLVEVVEREGDAVIMGPMAVASEDC